MEIKQRNLFVSVVNDEFIVGYSEGYNEVIVQGFELKKTREFSKFVT